MWGPYFPFFEEMIGVNLSKEKNQAVKTAVSFIS